MPKSPSSLPPDAFVSVRELQEAARRDPTARLVIERLLVVIALTRAEAATKENP